MLTLSKLFNIRPDEWRRLSILSVMAFLPIIAGIWAQITLTALFLVQVGVRFLPFIFLGDAVVVILSFAVYSAFADRFSHDHVLIGLTGLGSVGIVIGLVLIRVAPPAVSYSFLYLLHRIVYAVIGAHWGVYVNSFYDTRSAKRIFSVLASVIRIAGILAASSMALLNSLFSTEVIIVLWGISLLAVAVLAYVTGEQKSTRSNTAVPTTSYRDNIREGYRYIRQSSYLGWLAVMSILMMIITTVLNYQVLRIFDNAYKGDQEAISNFIGLIMLIGNLIILPVQMFMFSRIISFLGVAKTNLIFPITTLSVSGALVLFPLKLIMGALAHFNINIVNVGIRATNDELLYNAVPVRVKGRARGFINGFVEPFGTLVAAFIVGLPFISDQWFLSAVLLTVGLAYFLAALLVSREYSHALVKLLEQESFSFLLHSTTTLNRADSTTLNHLKARLDESTDPDSIIVMANILIELEGNNAVPVLEKLFNRNSTDLKAGILDLIVEAKLNPSDNFYLDLLHHEDARIRKSALTGLEQVYGRQNERYLQAALGLSHDKDLSIQGQVLSAMILSNNPTYRKTAADAVALLINSTEIDCRALGVQIMGQADVPAALPAMLASLQDPSNTVRIAAIQALETAVSRHPREVADAVRPHIPLLLQDPIERIRIASIRILGSNADASSLSILLPVLDNPNPRVRDAAVEVLTRAGKSIIPVLTREQPGKIASVVLARIDARRYGGPALSHAKQNLARIYENYSRLAALDNIKDYVITDILQLTILEQNRELIEETFYLLSALHEPESLRTIAESLKSGNPRVFANAVEALETLVPDPVARLIIALFDPVQSRANLVAIGQDEWNIQVPSLTEVIRNLLKDEDEWLQVIAIFILGEMGLELAAAQKAKPRPKGKLDLLAKLGEPEEASPVETPSGLFNLNDIDTLLKGIPDGAGERTTAVRAARRIMSGKSIVAVAAQQEENVLSVVEKIIFLKGVPLFEDMTINQLKVLANVCYE
jgi:HEAT repeat protein